MTDPEPFLLAERTRDAIADLVAAVTVAYDDLPAPVLARLPVVLTDLVGVAAAGLRTPELRALLAAWPLAPGRHPLPGSDVRTTPETAALLTAAAACSQELDEGNKHAAGHPAVHVVPAALAAAQQAGRPVGGRDFLAAVAGGYEVAARFGHAVRREPAWHTHGHWGATGAAYAAARILGASTEQVAAAVDAATGLMGVTPWSAVLAGDVTRNLWAGQAALAGLSAAHLARAGLVANRGGAAAAFALLGGLEPDLLLDGLDRGADGRADGRSDGRMDDGSGDGAAPRWLAAEGYLKQHAACSYTHAAIDLVLALRAAAGEGSASGAAAGGAPPAGSAAGAGSAGGAGAPRGWDADDVLGVRVVIHSLAAPLLQRHPANRLAAMFSLPFAVATAAVSGAVTPATMEPGTPAFAAAEAFSDRVHVEVSADLDRWLPARRVCEVEVALRDGRTLALAQPDPIGDARHFPLDDAALVTKLDGLLGPGVGAPLRAAVDRLVDADDVVTAWAALPLG